MDSRIVGLLKSVLTRQCPRICRIAIQPAGLTHHLPGAVRPRFAWIESLERPERPTQNFGKPEGSLSELADSNSGWLIQIVSTLRAFSLFGLYDSGA